MGSGNLWVEDAYFLWCWVSSVVKNDSFWLFFCIWVTLYEGLKSMSLVSGTTVDGGSWLVTSCLVWSSGKWIGIVMWDSGWLFSVAWGTSVSILWSISSIANWSGAVNTVWAIVSVAFWKSCSGGNNNWNPLLLCKCLTLNKMIRWSSHDNIFSKIFISDKSIGELK